MISGMILNTHFSKRLLLIAIIAAMALVVGPNNVQAQSSKVGTTAAPFLTMGTGSKASALGNSYTAMASGSDALFWNPAGISYRGEYFDELGSLLYSNYQWFAGIDYNAFGFTLPISANQVVGLSLVHLDYGQMDVTTVTQPDGTGERFTPTDLMIGLSFAQPLTESFYIGGTFKYIQQNIWDMTAKTVAVDIGFVLQTQYVNGLRLGASLMNFGGKMQMDGVDSQIFIDPDLDYGSNNDQVPVRYKMDEWNLPIQFKFGVAVPAIKQDYFRWDLMAESHQTNDQYLNADLGSEFRFMTNSTHFTGRVGYKDMPLSRDFNLDHVDSHWTFGIGLETQFDNSFRIGVDVAYIPFNNLGYARMFDMRFYF